LFSHLYGTGKKTTADDTTISRPSRPRQRETGTGAGPETPEEKIALLEAENAELRAEKTKLTTEREILRRLLPVGQTTRTCHGRSACRVER